MVRRKIKVGDRIRFKAATRWAYRAVVRKVVGFDHLGRPLVRYGGWGEFIVQPHEVLEVLA